MATSKKATKKKAPATATKATKATKSPKSSQPANEAATPAPPKAAPATNGEAVVEPVDYLHEIGSTAGEVWYILDGDGPMTLATLVRKSAASRDTVMQALGWLAREDKIVFDNSRTRKVSLR
ncbi:MAG: winged helix-turn-helix domain-containing protein [Pirellulales bacterium]|nr:winged helix-turn-helix domain-containing protein [Planctomycetales bacterium]